jgi:hypothetical protein
MSDLDLIRRGDAMALMRHDPFLIGLREEWAGMAPDEDGDWVSFHAIRALPAADPLADPRVQALVEALRELVQLNDDYSPFGGEMFQDRVNRTWDRARTALAAFKGDEA